MKEKKYIIKINPNIYQGSNFPYDPEGTLICYKGNIYVFVLNQSYSTYHHFFLPLRFPSSNSHESLQCFHDVATISVPLYGLLVVFAVLILQTMRYSETQQQQQQQWWWVRISNDKRVQTSHWKSLQQMQTNVQQNQTNCYQFKI